MKTEKSLKKKSALKIIYNTNLLKRVREKLLETGFSLDEKK